MRSITPFASSSVPSVAGRQRGPSCGPSRITRGIAGQDGARQAESSRQPTRIVMARASSPSSQAATIDKPAWAGDGPASRIANWAISTPWIFSLMKVGAKDQMKRTARDKGLDWDGLVADMRSEMGELEKIKAELERKDIVYPDYYKVPFHAYDEGNLSWLAAYEVEPATYCVALRAFGKIDPSLGPQDAYRRMAGGATNALKAYYKEHGLAEPKTIVDVGCSTGMSTRWLAEQYPQADITALDLSPYFLAVAEWHERWRVAKLGAGAKKINYVHGLAEDMGALLPPASVDSMMFQYVLHECPQSTIRDFIAESARRVKPGGTLFFVDNNPKSKTIQGLPPAIAILMKSTEPWSDEYYSFDVEAAMLAGGFTDIKTVEVDHRHRGIMGIKK